MTREMKLPALGESVENAEVIAVLVSVGDVLTPDQPIIELETDKATAEVPAPFAGTVSKIHVAKGDQVEVGQVLITVDEAAEGRNRPLRRRRTSRRQLKFRLCPRRRIPARLPRQRW